MTVLGPQGVAPQRGDLVAVGQVDGLPGAMHEDQPLEALPGRLVLQDRQVGRQPRAGAQHPQVTAIGEAVGGEEAVGLTLDHQAVTHLQIDQLRREGPAGHQDRVELQVVVPGGRSHRISPPHRHPVGVHAPQPRKLPRHETKTRLPLDAERQQARAPAPHPQDAGRDELVLVIHRAFLSG